MSVLEAFFLGLVQGLTEFLPISSSGHLVLAQEWLGVHVDDITFEVFVHFGTLLAVLIFFKRDVLNMVSAVLGWIKNIPSSGAYFKANPEFRMAVFIMIGSVPAAIAGLFFADLYEKAYALPFLVSCMLVVTGVILLGTQWASTKHNSVKSKDAIMMGIAQALAIMPGISRSGSTIGVGMFMGLEKYEAARFSFLLSLPAIMGATLMKIAGLLENPLAFDQVLPIFIGTVTAFASGYLAIRFLLDLIRRGKFSYFAYYCFAVGILGIILFGM